ncbi:MAG TPA: hypothetical protein VEQ63_05730 [Bryobacteraceae bacterium]|nr:hypothetical protein [Bryobacteraceae bacterium]
MLLGAADAGASPATSCKTAGGCEIMQLRFLGKDSTPTNSPTLYSSDEESYVVQGWIVRDSALLARLDLDKADDVVEIPPALMVHLQNDGLTGEVGSIVSPIVHVNEKGNFIIRGKRVGDPATLAQMDIPDYESCVEVPKVEIAALLVGR